MSLVFEVYTGCIYRDIKLSVNIFSRHFAYSSYRFVYVLRETPTKEFVVNEQNGANNGFSTNLLKWINLNHSMDK